MRTLENKKYLVFNSFFYNLYLFDKIYIIIIKTEDFFFNLIADILENNLKEGLINITFIIK